MSSLPTNYDEAFDAGLDGSISTIRSTTVYLGDDEATYYNIRTHHEEADHENTGVDHTHNPLDTDTSADTIMTLYRPSTSGVVQGRHGEYAADDSGGATGNHFYFSALSIEKSDIQSGDMLLVSAYGSELGGGGSFTTTSSRTILGNPSLAGGASNRNINIEIELNRGDEIVNTSAKWAAKHDTVPSEVEIINEPDSLANVALFIVKFLEGSSSSVAIGDPYIYPMRSSIPVKLPDAEACYRLYQSDNTFINAEVAIATKEHENRMMEFVEKLGHDTKNVITDGYFFSKFFIADGENKMVVDLRKKTLSLLEGSDKKFFHVKQNINNAGNKDWNGKARNVVVQWITEEGNIIKATVSFFANPHIENGISLSVTNLPKKALGICVSNYRPKLMRIPSLTTEKHGKIARQVKKSRNPFQKIAIKSNREGWVAKN